MLKAIKVPVDKNADVSVDDLYAMLAGDLLPSDIHKRRAEEQARKDNNKLIGAFQNKLEREYSSFSTRNLIKRLRESYGIFAVYVSVYELTDGVFVERFANAEGQKRTKEDYITYVATAFALKKVLATRPHLDNKIEGHNKRKAAATAHHGKKKPGGRRIKHSGTGAVEIVHHR